MAEHLHTAPGAYRSGPLVLENAALFTDLYELTMAASYLREGMTGAATFSLFTRRLPAARGFLIAAGLADTLDFLEQFRVTESAIASLAALQRLPRDLLDRLGSVRFTGSMRAVPEGTPVFADEPLLEITAPIVEAQLVESAVLSICHLQTLLTSKAARCVLAAQGKPVVEFGLRRTHGLDAGLKAARCAFIAGAEMTSDVLAGVTYGIPVTGTMAHSYITAFPQEIDAFRAFAAAFPSQTVLLIDTYDTIEAAHKAVQVACEMEARGERLAGVRLDSGDLVALSRGVRAVLDDAGLPYVQILASGNLDEMAIAHCVADGAPIDAYGVGTRMTVSADAPFLDMAYKLVRYAGRDVLKTSAGKETWTGEKQVYRRRDRAGRCVEDIIALRNESTPDPAAEPLLETVMREGRRVTPSPTLASVRGRCSREVAALPDAVRRLAEPEAYPVRYSERLRAHQLALRADTLVAEGAAATG
ncbi:MAG TPA: nicotinate phosphoribosyltransferase [Gemmatimonadales bacterium]|nr:nicotinate phosphoribosyltransferase [Gemmatimonadales bacterium]